MVFVSFGSSYILEPQDTHQSKLEWFWQVVVVDFCTGLYAVGGNLSTNKKWMLLWDEILLVCRLGPNQHLVHPRNLEILPLVRQLYTEEVSTDHTPPQLNSSFFNSKRQF